MNSAMYRWLPTLALLLSGCTLSAGFPGSRVQYVRSDRTLDDLSAELVPQIQSRSDDNPNINEKLQEISTMLRLPPSSRCTPQVFPKMKGGGFCVDESKLDEICSNLEMSQSADCSIFEGSWCCFDWRVLDGIPESLATDTKLSADVSTSPEETSTVSPTLAAEESSASSQGTAKTPAQNSVAEPAPVSEGPLLVEAPSPQTDTTVVSVMEADTVQPITEPLPTEGVQPAPDADKIEAVTEPSTVQPLPPVTEAEKIVEQAPTQVAPVLGQSCGSVDECADSGTTCSGGQCNCWWDKGTAAANFWACNTDNECQNKFPGHVCRPSNLCRTAMRNSGFCIPLGAIKS